MRSKENCCYWDEKKEECMHPAFPEMGDPENCIFYWGKDWLRYTGSDSNYLSSMPTRKSKELQNIEDLEIHTNDGSYEGEWDEERHKYR